MTTTHIVLTFCIGDLLLNLISGLFLLALLKSKTNKSIQINKHGHLSVKFVDVGIGNRFKV